MGVSLSESVFTDFQCKRHLDTWGKTTFKSSKLIYGFITLTLSNQHWTHTKYNWGWRECFCRFLAINQMLKCLILRVILLFWVLTHLNGKKKQIIIHLCRCFCNQGRPGGVAEDADSIVETSQPSWLLVSMHSAWLLALCISLWYFHSFYKAARPDYNQKVWKKSEFLSNGGSLGNY